MTPDRTGWLPIQNWRDLKGITQCDDRCYKTLRRLRSGVIQRNRQEVAASCAKLRQSLRRSSKGCHHFIALVGLADMLREHVLVFGSDDIGDLWSCSTPLCREFVSSQCAFAYLLSGSKLSMENALALLGSRPKHELAIRMLMAPQLRQHLRNCTVLPLSGPPNTAAYCNIRQHRKRVFRTKYHALYKRLRNWHRRRDLVCWGDMVHNY
jgi:hypothetical protein